MHENFRVQKANLRNTQGPGTQGKAREAQQDEVPQSTNGSLVEHKLCFPSVSKAGLNAGNVKQRTDSVCVWGVQSYREQSDCGVFTGVWNEGMGNR